MESSLEHLKLVEGREEGRGVGNGDGGIEQIHIIYSKSSSGSCLLPLGLALLEESIVVHPQEQLEW